MKKSLFLSLFFPLFVLAQPKAGYYDQAIGKYSAGLKTALYLTVSEHNVRTYKQLWTDFRTTDIKPDGTVWDMYSNCTYTFGLPDQDSGSGGGSECQHYNREHSFPFSWFNSDKSSAMYTELFHLYPADKYINNERGNLPYGETATSSAKTYLNGSKRGPSSFPGYSGTVFEPIDEYKGDFARTYFYVVTAYENAVASWKSDHLSDNAYPALNSWTVDLLLKWHRLDPVSKKETDRNNAVESIQNNRNPFIDYPQLADHIWGNKKGVPWSFKSGLDELKVTFSIGPNPVVDLLKIHTDESDLLCTIFDLHGRILLQQNLQGNNELSVAMLQNGMYLIQLSKNDRRTIQKFVINK